MLATEAREPTRIGSYIARGLARLYVTARSSEGAFDQYAGLSTNSMTEVLAQALYAANRQGRQSEPVLLPPTHERREHTWRGHAMTRYTDTFLGVEVTTSRELMVVLRALADESPSVMNRWDLSQATGIPGHLIPNRIGSLRRVLWTYPALSIHAATPNGHGWRLVLAGSEP